MDEENKEEKPESWRDPKTVGDEVWKQRAYREMRAYCPDLINCNRCNNPKIRGYLCNYCENI